MMLTDVLKPEMAVALGVAAFLLFLMIYAIGRLFSRGGTDVEQDGPRHTNEASAPKGPSYAEIAAREAEGFAPRGDEPVFTPAPDYASASMEIPAGASYTQIAVATAAAQQRGLKPRMASGTQQAAAAPVARAQPAQPVAQASAPVAHPVLSYAAIASQTVGEPRARAEAAPSPQRVDYSTVDVDLAGLSSYTAIAVAAARGQAAQAKTLH